MFYVSVALRILAVSWLQTAVPALPNSDRTVITIQYILYRSSPMEYAGVYACHCSAIRAKGIHPFHEKIPLRYSRHVTAKIPYTFSAEINAAASHIIAPEMSYQYKSVQWNLNHTTSPSQKVDGDAAEE